MKKIIALLLLVSLFVSLTACSEYKTAAATEAGIASNGVAFEYEDAYEVKTSTTPNTQATPEVTAVPVSVEYDDDDMAAGEID